MSPRTAASRVHMLAVVAVLGPLFAAGNEPGGRVALRAEKIRTDRGQVYCLLFDSADGFPIEPKKAKQGAAVD